nr:alpha/beta hydrolase [Herbaspirillum camelliae]
MKELITAIVRRNRTVLLDYRCLFVPLLWRTIRSILGPVAHAQAHIMQGSSSLDIRDFFVPGPLGRIPVRLYLPVTPLARGQKRPLVMYFHGGGFVSGSLEDADTPARFIAEHGQLAVLSVGYALAPAKPFPAAPEDAFAAATWACKNAAELKVDLDRMVVAGDDAGGCLAASLTLMTRDRCGKPLAAQVLISPMLDPSMRLLGDAARLQSDLTAETCAASYRQYLPQTMQRLHPYAAPLEVSRLAGLPPAFIATAERDVLCPEAEKYASSLIRAGVPTQVSRFVGITHAALRTHLPLLTEIVNFLRCRFAKLQGNALHPEFLPNKLQPSTPF